MSIDSMDAENEAVDKLKIAKRLYPDYLETPDRHRAADDALVEFLETMGFKTLADEYRKMQETFWYE